MNTLMVMKRIAHWTVTQTRINQKTLLRTSFEDVSYGSDGRVRQL